MKEWLVVHIKDYMVPYQHSNISNPQTRVVVCRVNSIVEMNPHPKVTKVGEQ